MPKMEMNEEPMTAGETSALALPTPADTLLPSKESPFPPTMRYCYGIESDATRRGAKPGHFYLFSGGYKDMTVQKILDGPYSACVMVSRNVAKLNKADNTSERAYLSGLSHNRFLEMQQKEANTKIMKRGKEVNALEIGYAYILALFFPDKSATMAIYEATTGTLPDYTKKMLGAGTEKEKTIVHVDIFNHEAPTITNPNGNQKLSRKGTWYLDPAKMTQYRQAPLSNEQHEMVLALYKARQRFVDEFCTK